MIRWRLWVPLIAVAVLFVVFGLTLLNPDDQKHPSKMVGKPFPVLTLPAAASDRPAAASGGPRLVNVFASWCIPCAAEAPILAELKRRGAEIDGIAIRDKRPDVDAFLKRNGNPYRSIGLDIDSSVQLAIGSSGVPETFVVDAKGIIRAQHIGDIREDDMSEILAKLREAQ